MSKVLINLKQKRFSLNRCAHRNLLIDSELALVECEDCGELLNPITQLLRIAHEQAKYSHEYEKYIELLKTLKSKNKVKCQHCNKFTPIERNLINEIND